MFGLAPFATEEGAEGPWKGLKNPRGPKGPQPSTGARMRGEEHPEFLVHYITILCTIVESICYCIILFVFLALSIFKPFLQVQMEYIGFVRNQIKDILLY